MGIYFSQTRSSDSRNFHHFLLVIFAILVTVLVQLYYLNLLFLLFSQLGAGVVQPYLLLCRSVRMICGYDVLYHWLIFLISWGGFQFTHTLIFPVVGEELCKFLSGTVGGVVCCILLWRSSTTSYTSPYLLDLFKVTIVTLFQ